MLRFESLIDNVKKRYIDTFSRFLFNYFYCNRLIPNELFFVDSFWSTVPEWKGSMRQLCRHKKNNKKAIIKSIFLRVGSLF